MRLAGFVVIIFLVATVFTVWTITVANLETYYIDGGISNASKVSDSSLAANLSGTADRVNDTFNPILEGFNSIQDPERGFFDQISDGAIVLPLAIIKLPGVLISVLGIGIDSMTEAANQLSIPIEILAIGVAGVFIFMMFKLVALWRRFEA